MRHEADMSGSAGRARQGPGSRPAIQHVTGGIFKEILTVGNGPLNGYNPQYKGGEGCRNIANVIKKQY